AAGREVPRPRPGGADSRAGAPHRRSIRRGARCGRARRHGGAATKAPGHGDARQPELHIRVAAAGWRDGPAGVRRHGGRPLARWLAPGSSGGARRDPSGMDRSRRTGIPLGADEDTARVTMSFEPWNNPMGTDGFEFVEYAAPDPAALGALFERLGFAAIARHRHKRVTLYRQGDINFIVNAEADSFGQRFARLHGPSICAIALRVDDAAAAYRRAVDLGAWGYDSHSGPMELNIPAIKGIGDSLIYFVDRWRGKKGASPGAIGDISIYDVDFEPLEGATIAPVGAGLVGIDHLTHNVHRG